MVKARKCVWLGRVMVFLVVVVVTVEMAMKWWYRSSGYGEKEIGRPPLAWKTLLGERRDDCARESDM